MTTESNMRDIERHCNNYFNPHNDPNDPTRDYPPEFIELADRIFGFRKNNKPSSITGENVIGVHSYSKAVKANGAPAGWQAVFAADLAVYKRAKFI